MFLFGNQFEYQHINFPEVLNMKFELCILLLAAAASAIPDASLCVEKVPEGEDPAKVGLLNCWPLHCVSLNPPFPGFYS